MRTALLLLLVLAASGLSSTAAAADVWKWVDESGVTHYSDRPVPGATRVELSSGNVVSSAPRDTFSPADVTSGAARETGNYQNFEIWRPESEQVFINTGGQVNVEVRIEPGVRQQHTLNLFLDGRRVEGQPRNALSYELTGIPRGVHNVTATVSDQAGQTIARSEAVAFTVRQESIANPPVGPSQRPPPKPQPRGAANKLPSTQPSYGALNGGRPAIDPATNRPVIKKPAPKPGKP